MGDAAASLPADDLAWTAFSEGMATRASRQVVPGRPAADYFWYGHPADADWLPWCETNQAELMHHFRVSLDIPEATDTFFGGGLVDGRWRVGYYLADVLASRIGASLPEMVAMSVDDARAAVTEAARDTAAG
jgi:hypothetical protein